MRTSNNTIELSLAECNHDDANNDDQSYNAVNHCKCHLIESPYNYFCFIIDFSNENATVVFIIFYIL